MHGMTRLLNQQSQLVKHGPVIIQMGILQEYVLQCNSHVSQRNGKLVLLDSNELMIALQHFSLIVSYPEDENHSDSIKS